MKLVKKIQRISPSLTLEITSKAKILKAKGHPVVNFAAGEPDFDTPEYIKKAAILAIKQGFTKYTPATGTQELKQAIARKLKRDNQLTYSCAQIVVSSGAKHTLYNLLQVLCEKGDEVLVASPYWLSYPPMVELTEARAVILNTGADNNFKLNKELLVSKITKKTKLLILNNPTNPTGSLYSRRELEDIAALVIRNNLYVISDEIYEKLVFDGKRHTSIASLNKQIYKHTIVVNGVSKAYAMTGWRIGYFASADAQVVQAVGRLQSHSTSNPSSISQKAALEALSRTNSSQMQKMVKEFQHRRDCMLRGLNKIAALSFIKPEGAFYVFCNIANTGLNSTTFTQRLLQEAKIAAIPGKAFGRDDYIRLSFATSRQQIEEGMRRLKNWVEKIS